MPIVKEIECKINIFSQILDILLGINDNLYHFNFCFLDDKFCWETKQREIAVVIIFPNKINIIILKCYSINKGVPHNKILLYWLRDQQINQLYEIELTLSPIDCPKK